MPETEFVTVFWPLTTTGAGELVVQAAGTIRFVVDCRVKPVALVGQVKMTLVWEGIIDSCGDGSVRLNMVPLVKAPPTCVVP